MLLGSRARPVRTAENLVAICEPIDDGNGVSITPRQRSTP
jgi:hypothetical protein